MSDYSVEIITSSRKLTAREEIAAKDTSNALSFDDELKEVNDRIVLTPNAYIELAVHNPNSKNDKDYKKYLIIDNAGNKYVTGSESFFTAFKQIFTTMSEKAPDEEYSIEVYKKPSKNYTGKYFLTCSILP